MNELEEMADSPKVILGIWKFISAFYKLDY